MIFIGRCPYRISLLGGGSDLDWFVAENNYGNSVGFSLAEYSYTVIAKKGLNSRYGILNYSSRETYSNLDNIAHSLIRESLKYFKISEFKKFNARINEGTLNTFFSTQYVLISWWFIYVSPSYFCTYEYIIYDMITYHMCIITYTI